MFQDFYNYYDVTGTCNCNFIHCMYHLSTKFMELSDKTKLTF